MKAILTLAIVLGAAALANAQPPEAQNPRANREGRITNGELVSMLDTYAIVQAQEALQLNDTQYGQFVTRLKRLQQIRRRNLQARNKIVQELRQMTGPSSTLDENAVRERLRALRDHDARADADLRKAYDEVDAVLDTRQQARFRIFEEQMERRKLDLLMRAREGARGRRGGS